jgi:hypothetical protein
VSILIRRSPVYASMLALPLKGRRGYRLAAGRTFVPMSLVVLSKDLSQRGEIVDTRAEP